MMILIMVIIILLVTDAHTIYRRSSSVTALLPPPNAIYVFTDDQIRDIQFNEPDSDDTITWTDLTDGTAILRRSFRNLSTDTTIIRSVTIIKLVEWLTSDYSGIILLFFPSFFFIISLSFLLFVSFFYSHDLVFTETPNLCDTLLYTLETYTTASCMLDLLAKRYLKCCFY